MGSDSILSERALREIYLKGFEIAIRESRPMSIMTSYNLINGIHAANCRDTCTAAARPTGRPQSTGRTARRPAVCVREMTLSCRDSFQTMTI